MTQLNFINVDALYNHMINYKKYTSFAQVDEMVVFKV